VTRIALIVRKDLRILRRSPVLLGMLLAYPLVIAVLVGLVAGYANSKPRVALVDEDGLPRKVVLAGETFNVQRTIDRVSENVNLVRLPRADAQRELRNGKLVAVLTVPRGFMADLRGMLHSPELRLQTAHGTLSNRVEQQVQALVYSLNRLLQDAYIKTNLGYVHALKHGATITFLGRKIDVLGLDRTAALLRKLPPSQRRARIEDFVHDAQLALRETDSAMRATANPIKLALAPRSGRSWALSAEVQAYALGLTIAFLTLLLAAGATTVRREKEIFSKPAALSLIDEIAGGADLVVEALAD
jgi:ABC-2 type transport system permease protein